MLLTSGWACEKLLPVRQADGVLLCAVVYVCDAVEPLGAEAGDIVRELTGGAMQPG